MKLGKKIVICTAIVLGASLVVGVMIYPKWQADRELKLEHFSEAEAIINGALVNPLFKDDPTMYVKRAEVRRHLEDFEAAHGDLDRALVLQQGNKILWVFGVGYGLPFEIFKQSTYVYQDEKQYEKALHESDEALKFGDDEALRLSRGKLFEELNQLDKAQNEFNLAVKKDSDHEMLVERAEFFWRQGKLDQAIKDMTEYLKEHRTEFAFNHRGCMFLDNGDYKSAMADFDQALSLDPQYEKAIENRKLAVEQLGQK